MFKVNLGNLVRLCLKRKSEKRAGDMGIQTSDSSPVNSVYSLGQGPPMTSESERTDPAPISLSVRWVIVKPPWAAVWRVEYVKWGGGGGY